LQFAIGFLMAGALALLVARAPAKGLVALVALLPFQMVGLALLYRWGMPATIVRALGGWKEAVVAGIVLAGIKGLRASGRKLDALDGLALAYLAVATMYLAVPSLFVHFGSGPVAQPPNLSVRLLAWRTDCLFVFAFLGLRHADIKAAARHAYVKAVLATGAVVAAVGVYELLDPSGWNNFAVRTARVPTYDAAILHVFLNNPYDIQYHTTLAGHAFTRVGSVLLSPLTLGFYLLVAFGLAIELIARRRTPVRTYVVVSLVAVALLGTITRGAILAAVVVLMVAFRPQRSRDRRSRSRFALILAAGLVLAAPVVVATGLSSRTSASVSGGQDAADHVSSLADGFNTLIARPLGRGLGTAPGIGNRFDTSGQITSESAYLQVGNELGMPAMIIFIAMLLLLVRRLGRAEPADDPAAPATGGLRAILLGLLVGGLFLHVWLDFTLTLAVWGGAGLALGVAERSRGTYGERVAPADHGTGPSTNDTSSTLSRAIGPWPK
jgi:hypothetical protein